MAAIEIRNLYKSYRGKKSAVVQALWDVSLTVQKGEVFGFLGPNGAGKSTTIKILTGQVRPSKGFAFLAGKPVDNYQAREEVGYLPENPAFYDFLTPIEYLKMVGHICGMDELAINIETDRVLDLLSLSQYAKRPIRTFSKGMIQRLGLAQALLHDPLIFILDEPMSGLDPLGRALVKDIIINLKSRNKTVFFSTHITADIEAVCDRVGILVDGRLHVDQPVRDIRLENPTLYVLEFQDKNGNYVQREMSEEDLRLAIEKVWHENGRIITVEPKNKDLEKFFLQTISTARKK